VNPKYKIELLAEGPKAHIYTIRNLDSEISEFERFADEEDVRYDPGFQEILARIDDMANRLGCIDSFFRNESARDNAICALFAPDGKLRLYCIKMRFTLLIIGGGGIKNTRTYQEDPHLDSCVTLLEDFWKRFALYEDNGEIEISSDGKITGKDKI